MTKCERESFIKTWDMVMGHEIRMARISQRARFCARAFPPARARFLGARAPGPVGVLRRRTPPLGLTDPSERVYGWSCGPTAELVNQQPAATPSSFLGPEGAAACRKAL